MMSKGFDELSANKGSQNTSIIPDSQKELGSNSRGRGRGYLLKLMIERRNSECSKVLPSTINSPKEVKKNLIFDSRPPIRSTYIPVEPDENDESIYDVGIHSGINFEKLNDDVKVTGPNIPKKMETFDNISKVLMENIKKCKYIKPTPIQKYTIPIILSGNDLMAAAQTGSGKTVAYVLPIIQKLLMEPRPLMKDRYHSEPQVIIMAPTRELAVQIKNVVVKLSKGTGISALFCYGGTLVSHQKYQILEGCHILVATPGRLNDFIQHGLITFTSVRFFVLDEVDRMLEVESKYDVDKILDHFSMPSVAKRQTIMLSATLPDLILRVASNYLNKNYLFLSVGIVSSASKDIKQVIYQVNKDKKRILLTNILKKDSKGSIVFVEKKWTADFLATYLCEKHIPSISIHGDRLQDMREKALNEFTKGLKNVLVSTAVASRGLDIACVNQVINYDMPEEIEEYVQRIGRTGRLGNQGKALSFLDVKRDYRLIEPLIRTLLLANQDIPRWLYQCQQKINEDEVNDDLDQFGRDTNNRIATNLVDENEEW